MVIESDYPGSDCEIKVYEMSKIEIEVKKKSKGFCHNSKNTRQKGNNE